MLQPTDRPIGPGFPASQAPPSASLKRAFPVPRDSRFAEFGVVLDRTFVEPFRGAPRKPVKKGAPRRVLPLAVLAVLIALVVARGAAEATWEMAGERYVDEIITERF
jgi:hypothetical protein